MTKTRIILVRHGETTWNKKELMQGMTDIPLSKKGENQALQVGLSLKSVQFDLIYTSPLKRAYKTAKSILAYRPKTSLIKHRALFERDFGSIEGKTFQEIQENYPQLIFNETWKYPYYAPPGGERLIEIQERLINFLNEILKKHEGKTIVVVSHGVTLRVAIGLLLNIPLANLDMINHLSNCSITVIETKELGRGQLLTYNFISE